MDTESAVNASMGRLYMRRPYENVGSSWKFTSFVILGAILKHQGSVEVTKNWETSRGIPLRHKQKKSVIFFVV